MISIEQYQSAYPVLASFANSKDSPTYTRKSKSGKMVLVKKGKRKKNKLALTGGALGGALVGNAVGGSVIVGQLKKAGLDPKEGLAAHRKLAAMGTPGGNLLRAAGGLGAIGVGGYLGYKLAKKLTND